MSKRLYIFLVFFLGFYIAVSCGRNSNLESHTNKYIYHNTTGHTVLIQGFRNGRACQGIFIEPDSTGIWVDNDYRGKEHLPFLGNDSIRVVIGKKQLIWHTSANDKNSLLNLGNYYKDSLDPTELQYSFILYLPGEL